MTAEDIVGLVKHVAHWLPTQGPIKEFVHHNTLRAYQNYFKHCPVPVNPKPMIRGQLVRMALSGVAPPPFPIRPSLVLVGGAQA